MARVKQIDREALEAKAKAKGKDGVDALEAFARKGAAAAAAAAAATSAERHFVQLRLDAALLARIDAAKDAKRRKPPSRHEWIVDAIYEKLDREE